MVGGPNELPEGGEGGGGFHGGIHGEFPGENPAELPVDRFRNSSLTALVAEILATRNRVHELENQRIVDAVVGRQAVTRASAFFRGGIGGPNELPEGGEGGGGRGGRGEFPGENPAELPIDFTNLARLETRLTALETRLVESLNGIREQIQQISANRPG